jgi:FkbM family methyltransferase
MSKVLIYIGLNQGGSFDKIYRDYDVCYGFEPIPLLAGRLQERYRAVPHVHIVNAAVCVNEGPVSFFVSQMEGDNNNMQSSSLCEVSEGYRTTGPRNQVFTREVITVQGINLAKFLTDHGITEIDTYISDAEGFDFSILQTVRPWFDERRVKNAQFESEPDYVSVEQRVGQPANKSSLFIDALINNYDLVGMQQGNYDPNSPTRWFNRDLEFRVKADGE